MTSEAPNLHVSKNLNISRTKQNIEKLKTPLRLVWKCSSVVFKIGSKIFSLQWHFKYKLNPNIDEPACSSLYLSETSVIVSVPIP